MPKRKRLIIYLNRILPTSLISRIAGFIARRRFPQYFTRIFLNFYCKRYNVNRDEYIEPENGFKTFDQFFTRKLKDGIHRIDRSKNSIISPVDGRIDQFGSIDNVTLIQAKGINYSLKDLLPSEYSNNYTDGSFITIYLSPGDYHRIHSPVSGTIDGYFSIPGKLLTVQDCMVENQEGIFSINERIISYINNRSGKIAVCKVGATVVGRIALSYSDILTNKTFRRRTEVIFDENDKPDIKTGDELGIFHLGSTIIMLFEKGCMEFTQIKEKMFVRVGEKIGILK